MDDVAPSPEPPGRPSGPHPERHPDDLPPVDDPALQGRGRGLPRGVLWALALAVVVLAIASWTALSSDHRAPAATGSETVVLDRNTPAPTIGSGAGAIGGSGGGLGGRDVTGAPAPATSFESFDGATTTLEQFRGRPVVLNFWASSCTPCITEMPTFESVHRDYGDRVQFVGLATADGEDAARQLAQRTGVSYLLGWDRTGAIATSFGAIGLPTTIVIGADGTVVDAHTGTRSAEELRALIDQSL